MLPPHQSLQTKPIHFPATPYLSVQHNLYLFPPLTSIQQINSGSLYVYWFLILVFRKHLFKITFSLWKKNHIYKNLLGDEFIANFWPKSMFLLWKTLCELVFSWNVDNIILTSISSIYRLSVDVHVV